MLQRKKKIEKKLQKGLTFLLCDSVFQICPEFQISSVQRLLHWKALALSKPSFHPSDDELKDEGEMSLAVFPTR